MRREDAQPGDYWAVYKPPGTYKTTADFIYWRLVKRSGATDYAWIGNQLNGHHDPTRDVMCCFPKDSSDGPWVFVGRDIQDVLLHDTRNSRMDYDPLALEDLQFDTYRASGGMGVSVTDVTSAVRIVHKPTGLVAICQEHKSQLRNKNEALEELRVLVRQYAIQRCAKCNEHRPATDYLCDRCRKLLDAVYCRDAEA